MDDYIEVTSLMGKPYWEKVEYEVPDNWWHSTDYYNVPLDVYMDVLKQAIRNGYSMSVGGDVSEAGFDSKSGNIAVVPTFDIKYLQSINFRKKCKIDIRNINVVP